MHNEEEMRERSVQRQKEAGCKHGELLQRKRKPITQTTEKSSNCGMTAKESTISTCGNISF